MYTVVYTVFVCKRFLPIFYTITAFNFFNRSNAEVKSLNLLNFKYLFFSELKSRLIPLARIVMGLGEKTVVDEFVHTMMLHNIVHL